MILTYMKNGQTLRLDAETCTGCGACVDVCPHAVFALVGGRASIVRRATCMECGACKRNCPVGAIAVEAGVGCAGAIIIGKLRGTEPNCGGEACCDSKSGKATCC